MQKRVLAAFVVAAVMGPVGAASAAEGRMLFHNNSPSTWRLATNPPPALSPDAYWSDYQESPIGSGDSSYGAFEYTPSYSKTTYSATWEDVSDGTSCTFESWSVKNSYGNVRFGYAIPKKEGPRASVVKCTGSVPTTTNGTGTYQFDYYVSY
jgi:hypothetical protein